MDQKQKVLSSLEKKKKRKVLRHLRLLSRNSLKSGTYSASPEMKLKTLKPKPNLNKKETLHRKAQRASQQAINSIIYKIKSTKQALEPAPIKRINPKDHIPNKKPKKPIFDSGVAIKPRPSKARSFKNALG